MIKLKRTYIFIVTTLLLALASCKEHTTDSSRVLLVYIGIDNNLNIPLLGIEQGKLNALRTGHTGRATDHIIVYVDNGTNGARLIEIPPNGKGERLIASYEIGARGHLVGTDSEDMTNSASWKTLSHVISDVADMFPAKSYGLLVFSHASGWLPEHALAEFEKRGISPLPIAEQTSTAAESAATVTHCANTVSTIDSSDCRFAADRTIIVDGSNEMSIADFAKAIPKDLFDYIVFEACFMAGVEVAYELRDKTPVIFASSAEIVHPGLQTTYASKLSQLLARDITGFGQSAFNNILAYPADDVTGSATYSVIRTGRLNALADFVRLNCDFDREVNIADIQHFDRLKSGNRLFFDFEDYYSRLLDTDEQRAELSRLIAACVVWKQATPEFMTQDPKTNLNGFVISNHSGLTTYIPQPAFGALNEEYALTSWSEATRQ